MPHVHFDVPLRLCVVPGRSIFLSSVRDNGLMGLSLAVRSVIVSVSVVTIDEFRVSIRSGLSWTVVVRLIGFSCSWLSKFVKETSHPVWNTVFIDSK